MTIIPLENLNERFPLYCPKLLSQKLRDPKKKKKTFLHPFPISDCLWILQLIPSKKKSNSILIIWIKCVDECEVTVSIEHWAFTMDRILRTEEKSETRPAATMSSRRDLTIFHSWRKYLCITMWQVSRSSSSSLTTCFTTSSIATLVATAILSLLLSLVVSFLFLSWEGETIEFYSQNDQLKKRENLKCDLICI